METTVVTTKVSTSKSSSAEGAAVAAAASSSYSSTSSSSGRQIVISRAHGHLTEDAGSWAIEGSDFSSGSYSSMSAGATAAMAATGVNTIVSCRSKQKTELQNLNTRFSSYIEKVRYLEAQNRKLAVELKSLREQWTEESNKIKETYEAELKLLRVKLDECERLRADVEVKITSLEDRISEIKILIDEAREQEAIDLETIQVLNRMIQDYQSEIVVLRKRSGRFDDDRGKDKNEVTRLRAEIDRLRTALDKETTLHIYAENESQTIREELEFHKKIHEAELKQLTSLAYRDTTKENRDFWKAELSHAIHDIQTEYDAKLESVKVDLEAMFSIKVTEYQSTNTTTTTQITHIKEGNTRVKTQLSNLRERIPQLETKSSTLEAQIQKFSGEIEEMRRNQEIEMAALTKELSESRIELSKLLKELRTLLDAKLSLELEIAAYRKLLEGEETRISGFSYSAGMSSSSSGTVIVTGTSSSVSETVASESSSSYSSSTKVIESSKVSESSSTKVIGSSKVSESSSLQTSDGSQLKTTTTTRTVFESSSCDS